MEDDLPAEAVDADIVVELAQHYAILYRGLAAILFVLNVVHIAIDRWAVAARPRAVLVAEQDRPADIPRDAG
jgi:hypothetical protein